MNEAEELAASIVATLAERIGRAFVCQVAQQPCVYLLFSGRELRYVGSTRRPGARIGAHTSRRTIQFDGVRVVPTSSVAVLLQLESLLIHRLQPPANRQFCTLKRRVA